MRPTRMQTPSRTQAASDNQDCVHFSSLGMDRLCRHDRENDLLCNGNSIPDQPRITSMAGIPKQDPECVATRDS